MMNILLGIGSCVSIVSLIFPAGGFCSTMIFTSPAVFYACEHGHFQNLFQ